MPYPRETLDEKLDAAHEKLDKILEWVDGPPSKSHEGMRVRFDRVERLVLFTVGIGKIGLGTLVSAAVFGVLAWLGFRNTHGG